MCMSPHVLALITPFTRLTWPVVHLSYDKPADRTKPHCFSLYHTLYVLIGHELILTSGKSMFYKLNAGYNKSVMGSLLVPDSQLSVFARQQRRQKNQLTS